MLNVYPASALRYDARRCPALELHGTDAISSRIVFETVSGVF